MKKLGLIDYLIVANIACFSLLVLPYSLFLSQLLSVSSSWLLLLGLAIWLGINLLSRYLHKVRIRKIIPWVNILLVFINTLLYVQYRAEIRLQRAEQVVELMGKQSVELEIVQILKQRDYQTVIAKLNIHNTDYRFYLNWRPAQMVQYGEIWRATLRVKGIYGRLNEGGFDRQKWLYANHIDGLATVVQAERIGQKTSWRNHWLQSAVQQTRNLSQQGLLLALGFGERFKLSNAQMALFQQTNTAHLIAISGLHIGLAMWFGFLAARGVQLAISRFWVSPVFALSSGVLVALLYSYLAGFSIPTSRAMLAIALYFIVRLWRHHWTIWQFLLVVVSLLLLFDPLMLLAQSFWLSLGAVICILLWQSTFPFLLFLIELTGWQKSPNPLLKCLEKGIKVRSIWLIIHLQLGLLCLFLPIQLFFFSGTNLLGWWVNLLLVPIFSFIIIPLILFTILTQNYFSSWQWIDKLLTMLIAQLEGYSQYWYTFSMQESIYIISGCCIMLLGWLYGLYYYQRKETKVTQTPKITLANREKIIKFKINIENIPHTRKLIKLALIYLACWGVFILLYVPIKRSNWHLEMLDIGQGLSLLIVKNQHAILYDTASSWQNGSMAELEIIPYIQRNGLMLDKIILSHDDNDHSGGVNTILAYFPNAELYSSSLFRYAKASQPCFSEKFFTWQGLHFSFLAPQQLSERAKNSDSCVLLVEDKQQHYRVLLTGDISEKEEQQLLPKIPPLDVLQIAHHGSKTSSSTIFLQQSAAKIALISSGRWNMWQFPHSVVTARLQHFNIATYNTATAGQISILFHQDKIKVKTQRHLFSAWYRRTVGENW